MNLTSGAQLTDLLPSWNQNNTIQLPITSKYECHYHHETTNVFPDHQISNFTEIIVSTSKIASSILHSSAGSFYCYQLPDITFCQFEVGGEPIPILPFKNFESVGYLVPQDFNATESFLRTTSFKTFYEEHFNIEAMFKEFKHKTMVSLKVPPRVVSCLKYDELQTYEELNKLRLNSTALESWFKGLCLVFALISTSLFFLTSGLENQPRRFLNTLISQLIFHNLFNWILVNIHTSFPMLYSFGPSGIVSLGIITFGLMVSSICAKVEYSDQGIKNFFQENGIQNVGNSYKHFSLSVMLLYIFKFCATLSNLDNIYIYSAPALTYLISPHIGEPIGGYAPKFIISKLVLFLLELSLLVPWIFVVFNVREPKLDDKTRPLRFVLLFWVVSTVGFEIYLSLIYGNHMHGLSHSIINRIYMCWSQICLISGSVLLYFQSFYKKKYELMEDIEL